MSNTDDNIETIINKVNDLNKKGISLTGGDSKDRYTQAIRFHHQAASLSETYDLDPNYRAVSLVNAVYCERQRDNNREKQIKSLDRIMRLLRRDLDEDSHTHFGKARIQEERALVIRYNADKINPLEDLLEGIVIVRDSIELYELALKQPLVEVSTDDEGSDMEIATEDQIKDRLYRVTGIAATLAMEASKYVVLYKRLAYLRGAAHAAIEEVELRLDNGETEGFGLMNAYHTLGAVQSELVSGNDGMHEQALDNLEKAKNLTDNPMVNAALDFRFAWLSYAHAPEDTSGIAHLMDKVLDTQPQWNQALRDLFEPRMHELAEHLDGVLEQPKYVAQVDAMYSS